MDIFVLCFGSPVTGRTQCCHLGKAVSFTLIGQGAPHGEMEPVCGISVLSYKVTDALIEALPSRSHRS